MQGNRNEPCRGELCRFYHYGVVDKRNHQFFGFIENDRYILKARFDSSMNIVNRFYESKIDGGRSYAKYRETKLVCFDSIDSSGARLIGYYYGLPSLDDSTVLPTYLRLE